MHLTESGRKLIECAFADHEAAMNRATAGLSPAERKSAALLLRKLGLTAQASLAAADEAELRK